jgi:Concanavalin A-like lectin/glucanases superfamily
MRTWTRLRVLGLVLAGLLAVPLAVLVFQDGDDALGSTAFRLGAPPASALAPPAAAAAAEGPPTAHPAATGVRYGFDQGLGDAVHSLEGQLSLRRRVAAGGTLTTIPHGAGLAVRFPRPCAQYGTQRCQRAILQSGPAGFLNPGTAPFRYGASVLLAPSETSKGANVVQKGFSVRDAQFKLQVDGYEGRPSCVLVGTSSPSIYVALSTLTVANSQWHQIECTRSSALLTISIDGKSYGQVGIPPSLSIVNDDPLCIGGKGTSANNDQFTGAIDDVFVTRSP